MLTLNEFLECVVDSGLLTREQIGDSLRSLPADVRADPRAVADHLVFAGLLTDFQAQKLLRGLKKGLVLGHYQVLWVLAKGGMSTVYLARDQRGGKLAALKVLPPKRAKEGDRQLIRFRREMELSQKLAHANIAYVYEIGVHHKKIYFLALEYVPGESLSQLVKRRGPISWKLAAKLFGQIASALSHAHERGLIHRDVKPGNIMVTPENNAKLLDFGLALIPGELEMLEVVGGKGYVIGTMDYIAPEQIVDSSLANEQSDLYGLGCSMYFALTGQPPFPNGTKHEKMLRHLNEEPKPLRELAPETPPEFAALVAKLMAKKPEERLASAHAVEEALAGR
jgi:serine/threonine protein kinase